MGCARLGRDDFGWVRLRFAAPSSSKLCRTGWDGIYWARLYISGLADPILVWEVLAIAALF